MLPTLEDTWIKPSFCPLRNFTLNLRLLKPLDELLSFRYLNEIREENEHFNSTTLNNK
jgi:hypothetical protein